MPERIRITIKRGKEKILFDFISTFHKHLAIVAEDREDFFTLAVSTPGKLVDNADINAIDQ